MEICFLNRKGRNQGSEGNRERRRKDMSRSNYGKPFYVDVGTSIAAVRCASDREIVAMYDHGRAGRWAIEEAERICDKLNSEVKSAAGNTAEMREVLIWMKERMNAAIHDGSFDCDEALAKLDAALSAPPRNCDVGTVEEQRFRQSEYCKKSSMGNGCSQCPLKDTLDCRFAWMQMPYEAEEGDVR
jgi:hypothetical protein